MIVGNTDCPECGGYGWVVLPTAPHDAYEKRPCPDCVCPRCHMHTAAGEPCAASCGEERAA